jgi:hypothetical protein
VIVESLEQIKARAEAAVPGAENDIVPTEIRDLRTGECSQLLPLVFRLQQGVWPGEFLQ